MIKKLHLNLQRKWFSLIAIGIKTEEYREIKPYWTNRLIGKEYDTIVFRNGYGQDVPEIEIELLSIGEGFGREEWGAEKGKQYFILRF